MTDKRIMAVFIPEAWINDNAVEVDGRVEFDATDQILAMSQQRREELRDDSYESDQLVPTEILARHSGPFRVEVESAMDAYFPSEEG